MKAYLIIENNEAICYCWATSRAKAKYIGLQEAQGMAPDTEYIDIRALRTKELDNKEQLTNLDNTNILDLMWMNNPNDNKLKELGLLEGTGDMKVYSHQPIKENN